MSLETILLKSLSNLPGANELNHNVAVTSCRNSLPSIDKYGGETNEDIVLPQGGNGRLYGIAAVREQCPQGTVDHAAVFPMNYTPSFVLFVLIIYVLYCSEDTKNIFTYIMCQVAKVRLSCYQVDSKTR